MTLLRLDSSPTLNFQDYRLPTLILFRHPSRYFTTYWLKKTLKFSLKIRVRLKFVGFSLRPNFSTIQKIKVVGLIKYLRDIEFTYKLFNFKFPRT